MGISDTVRHMTGCGWMVLETFGRRTVIIAMCSKEGGVKVSGSF